MLQNLRNKTQSWIAYIIIGALILSFALWGVSSYFGGGAGAGVVAKVGKVKIGANAFAQSLNRFNQAQQQQLGGEYSPTQEQNVLIKKSVLQSMILHNALIQYVYKSGFGVSRKQIDQVLYAIPAFQENGQFSPAMFKRYLQMTNTPGQQFIYDFKTSLMIDQLNTGFADTEFVTNVEMAASLSLMQQERKFTYAIIDPAQLGDLKITSSEISDYYDANKQSFQLPEKVQISYVVLSESDLVKSIKPTQDQLKTFYQQNISRYSEPQRWQVDVISAGADVQAAEKISVALKDGAGVSDIDGATLVNEDVWLTEANLPPSVTDVLSEKTTKGSVERVQDGGGTYMLYLVRAYEPAQEKSFDEAKQAIAEAYANVQANKQYIADIEKITDLAYEQPDSLQPVAKAFDLTVKQSGFFAQDEQLKGVLDNPFVSKAAYSDDVLLGKNNSDVIKLADSSVIVLRVNESHAATQQTLAQVSNEIEKLLEKKKISAASADQAKAVAQALNEGDANQVSKKYQQQFTTTPYIGRFSQDIDRRLITTGFSETIGQASLVALDEDKYGVIKAIAAKDGSAKELSEKDTQMYQSMLIGQWNSDVVMAIDNAVLLNTKIKLNDKVLAQS
jgi:peptidyl-prolyl cis-trans isomerase D